MQGVTFWRSVYRRHPDAFNNAAGTNGTAAAARHTIRIRSNQAIPYVSIMNRVVVFRILLVYFNISAAVFVVGQAVDAAHITTEQPSRDINL